jgi:phage terminase small subunit
MREKPKDLKIMQGTFEPSKEGLDPVEYGMYERIPTAPDGWPIEAQKIWMDRCADLKQSGYLVKAMIAPLRRYCFAVYQAEVAEQKILSIGEGVGFTETKVSVGGNPYETLSVWVSVLDNATKTIERLGAKFGFTPLDIQKIPKIEKSKGTEMSLLK